MSDRMRRFTASHDLTRIKRAAGALLFVLLSWAGSVAAITVAGPVSYRWHGAVVELRLMPARRGQTRIELPPLGQIRAYTHATPVALMATLKEIDPDEVKRLVRRPPDREQLAADFERNARRDLLKFAMRQVLIGAVGALFCPLLLRSRRFAHWAASAVLGAITTTLVIGFIFTSFNARAFREPIYTGTLREAPWIIQFGRDAFNKVDALSQKLERVATNLNVLYGRIETSSDKLTPDAEADAFRILHVSDLHNNVAAMDFVRRVAQQFHVAFIVDTGDLTDFGSPPEIALVREIGKLPYQYVFVAGNHDSLTVVKELSRLANVTVLNGQDVLIQGIRLFGVPNPASGRVGVGSVDNTPDALAQGGMQALTLMARLPHRPDIVMIHDPEESRPLWGRAPLILCGHVHRYYVRTEAAPASGGAPTDLLTIAGARVAEFPPCQSLICNAGTTGAAGLRYFEQEAGVPFSCEILTFDRSSVEAPKRALNNLAVDKGTNGQGRIPQLRTVDQIALDGSLGTYSISHHVMESPSIQTPGNAVPAGSQ